MALLESNSFEYGKLAPNFSLLDTVSDKFLSLYYIKGNIGTVIMFICNHCPFVIYVNDQLVEMANEYMLKDINFIAISSNDIGNYHQDGPRYMKRVAAKLNYPFPYLYDESQEVAKQYDAVCTPDFYVFDENLKSVYHGQLDGARPGNGIEVTGSDIRNALDKLLLKEVNHEVQKPSIGCSIKWK